MPLSLNAAEKRIYTGLGNSNFPPYEFLDEYGRPTGFNIEIIRAAGEAAELEFQIILMPYDEALTLFNGGGADFMTGIFHEKGDTSGKLYSSPALNIPFFIAIKNDSDMNMKPVVRKKTAYNSKYPLAPLISKSMPHSVIKGFDSDISVLRSVSDGSSGSAVISHYSAYYIMDKYGIDDIRIIPSPVLFMDYSLQFSGGNDELMNRFNKGLQVIMKNGKYDRIHNKWFSPMMSPSKEKQIFILISFLIFLFVVSLLIILFNILLRREVKSRTGALHKEINHNYYIADLSRKLLGDASIERISRTVLEYLAELTDSYNGVAGYIGSEPAQEIIALYSYSLSSGLPEFKCLNLDYQKALEIKEMILKNTDAFFSNNPDLIFPEEALPAGHLKLQNVLCSPILISNEIAGFLLMSNANREYDEEDLNIIENFSSQYALAIQRMRFERDLIKSEKKYRDIFDNVEDLLYLYDLEGNFTEVNNAFLKTLGYSEDDVSSLNIVRLLAGGKDGIYTEEEVRSILDRVFTEGYIHGEVKVRTKYGNNVIIEYKNSLIIDEEGKPAGVRGSARDITERKIDEKLLVEAKEKASESDKLKTNFLANMSHEIRTPLNAILGFTDILIEEVKEPQHENYLRMIQKSGKLLLSIIDEILDLSKIESGSLKIVESPFNIKSLLKNLYNNTFILIRTGKKNVSLDYYFDHRISEIILGDEYRVEQVMNNLLSNAVKFTDTGEINFGVKVNDKRFLEFYVEDTGIGISQENIPLVFERFRQIDYGNRRSYSGTGLGLSISRMIVEMMGGTIRVDSEVNRGSRFTFSIPYRHTEKEEMVKTETNTTGAGSRTILVVEDNSINRLLVTRILEKNGYTCLMAIDGFEAVETYKKKQSYRYHSHGYTDAQDGRT